MSASVAVFTFAVPMTGILKNIKALLAVLLLAIFAVVMVPRQLWHHCESDSHHHEAPAFGEVISDGAHCAICDFQLQPFHYSFETSEWIALPLFAVRMAAPYREILPEPFREVSGRAPPVLT